MTTGLQDGLADRLAELPPGPELAAALDEVSRESLCSTELVLLTQARQRMVSYYNADLLADVRELAVTPWSMSPDPTERMPTLDKYSGDQVGTALTCTTRNGEALAGLGQDLVVRLPMVLAALRAGQIDLRRAEVFSYHLEYVDDPVAQRIAEHYLKGAHNDTPERLGRKLRYAVLKADPDQERKRRDDAVTRRYVRIGLARNGTAYLEARGIPVPAALSCDNLLERLASAAKSFGDPRSRTQLRVDAMTDQIRGIVFHTVPTIDPLTAAADEEARAQAEAERREAAEAMEGFRQGYGFHAPGARPEGQPHGSTGGLTGSGSVEGESSDRNGSESAESARLIGGAGLVGAVVRRGDLEKPGLFERFRMQRLASARAAEQAWAAEVAAATHWDPDDSYPTYHPDDPYLDPVDPADDGLPHGDRAPVTPATSAPTPQPPSTSEFSGGDARSAEPPITSDVVADRRADHESEGDEEPGSTGDDGGVGARAPRTSCPECNATLVLPAPRRGVTDIAIDYLTLAGLAREPGLIPGWGPIAADVARQIALDPDNPSTWRVNVYDRERLLAQAVTRRRPTRAERAFVNTRDQTCRFPNCDRAAIYCDHDHCRQAQHGGNANRTNLGPACAHHHDLRHEHGIEHGITLNHQHYWVAPDGRWFYIPSSGLPSQIRQGPDTIYALPPTNQYVPRIAHDPDRAWTSLM